MLNLIFLFCFVFLPRQDVTFIAEPQMESNRLYGISSWYDFTFNDDGSTRLCFIDREDCYTGAHFTAAMRDVPRYTTVKVTNLTNGKSVDVFVNDYGPEKAVHPDRIIDLSSAAFSELADLSAGIMEVMVEW